jgi:hypothetical protein
VARGTPFPPVSKIPKIVHLAVEKELWKSSRRPEQSRDAPWLATCGLRKKKSWLRSHQLPPPTEQPQDDQESNGAPLPPAFTICCCPCRRFRNRPFMHMPDASPQWFASFLILLCSTFIYYVRICLFVSFPIFQRCASVDVAKF